VHKSHAGWGWAEPGDGRARSGRSLARGRHDGGMCGRFVASMPVSELAEVLDAVEVLTEAPDGSQPPAAGEDAGPPRWNIAPQAAVWALTAKANDDGEMARRLRLYHWGLVPHWSKGLDSGARSFNARAESLFDKSMFSAAVARRRCIVPADAFYEWTRVAGSGGRPVRKQPWCFRAADGELLAFAGLWEFWRDRSFDGDKEDAPMLRSCTIVTCAATGPVAGVHDRSPVVLPRETWEDWLSPDPLPPAELADLLAPAPEGLLVGFPVSRRVNDAREDDATMVEPVDPDADEGGEASGSRDRRKAPDPNAQSLFDLL
jgi:putative SOS response-associated peptidase YedK